MPGPRHCSQLTRSDWLSGGSAGLAAGLLIPATRAPRSARGFGLPSSSTESVSGSGLPTSPSAARGGSTTRGAAFGGSSKSTAVRLPRLAEMVLASISQTGQRQPYAFSVTPLALTVQTRSLILRETSPAR